MRIFSIIVLASLAIDSYSTKSDTNYLYEEPNSWCVYLPNGRLYYNLEYNCKRSKKIVNPLKTPETSKIHIYAAENYELSAADIDTVCIDASTYYDNYNHIQESETYDFLMSDELHEICNNKEYENLIESLVNYAVMYRKVKDTIIPKGEFSHSREKQMIREILKSNPEIASNVNSDSMNMHNYEDLLGCC
ncbi:unnamed protein product [Caenorhabditis angaria]|uniref:Uncharacterized protein n=1 Tax=Caenorhabditis angaria TaxID=860376 RepID=A0A9P1N647_9PELO|nr:unnamed protein product [Caenorhabditis angaria]